MSLEKHFPESLAALEKLCQTLGCCKCGEIPTEKVYILGNCFDKKYCLPCAESEKEKTTTSRSVEEDVFACRVIKAVLQLKELILEKDEDANNESPKVPQSHEAETEASTSASVVPAKIDEDAGDNNDGTKKLEKRGKKEKVPLKKIKVLKEEEKDNVKENKDKTPARRTRGRGNMVDFSDKLKTEEPDKLETTTPIRQSVRMRQRKDSKTEGGAETETPAKKKKSSVSATRKGENEGDLLSSHSSVPSTTRTPKTRVMQIIKTESIDSDSPTSSKRSKTESPASIGNISFCSSGGSVSKAEKKNAKGETNLHIACQKGDLVKAQVQVISGSDPNAQDFAGWTPLHEAINGKASPSCKLELVKLLCEDATCNVNIPGLDNETALHEAARGGLKEIVIYLLSHGASPNIRNRLGKLPRDVAANEDISKLLDPPSVSDNSDVSASAEEDDPVVLAVQMSKALLYFAYDVDTKVLAGVERVLNLKVTRNLGGDVTHVVFPENEVGRERKVAFSYAYLHGIANGAWIVGSKWIEDSLAAEKILSPTAFEISGCNAWECENAPRSARVNKGHGKPGLLHGFCFYFYKATGWNDVQKKDLSVLVNLAGGQVIIREPNPASVDPLDYPLRFHLSSNNHQLILTSHIILYDAKNKPPVPKMYNLEHMKTLSVRWLIDTIGTFTIRDPENYL